MGFEGLTHKQRADAMACKTVDEMLAYMRETDAELTREEFFSLAECVEWRADARRASRPLCSGAEMGLPTA